MELFSISGPVVRALFFSLSGLLSQPCTQSLETLNLGHNSVGNEGVHKLKDGLIANRSVLRLGLASTKLSCEGGTPDALWMFSGFVFQSFFPFSDSGLCRPCSRSRSRGRVHRREPPTTAPRPPGERDQDGRPDGAVARPEGQHLAAAPRPGPRAQERDCKSGNQPPGRRRVDVESRAAISNRFIY